MTFTVNEKDYLLYLIQATEIPGKTKMVAQHLLLEKYPDEYRKIFKMNTRPEYRIAFRYKDMTEYSPAKKDIEPDTEYFKATASYRVYGQKGNQLMSEDSKVVKCKFYNGPAQNEGEINPLYKLTYKELNEDLKKQILLQHIEDIVAERLKQASKNWTDWEEVIVALDTAKGKENDN